MQNEKCKNIDDDLNLASYEYLLPPELIAQEPLPERDSSRLLVLRRGGGKIEHRRFSDIVEYLSSGDCLVINRTKVVPARLFGRKETGGKVEILFLKPPAGPAGVRIFPVLLKPFLACGKTIVLPDGSTAKVNEKTPMGETLLEFSRPDVSGLLAKFGRMPLPPYIKREKVNLDHHCASDKERYQTVYAHDAGSIAAPTAGLHFTATLISRLEEKGVKIAEITLHVGWGTFRPVTSADVTQHAMLPEYFEISPESAALIQACRKADKKIFAVGTTSIRTLESAYGALEQNEIPAKEAALKGETSLFIHPGHRFKLVDHVITNFHLPRSTPLLLASAFAGRGAVLSAYEAAIKERYRFYSYGDAMLII